MERSLHRQDLRRLSGLHDVYVLSLDNPAVRRAARLSAAERDIVHALLAGRSNEEIATLRRTSVKTVANQLGSLFERFGVHSRVELVRKLEAELTP